jgi:8-oxo-dGTP diphosphatase
VTEEAISRPWVRVGAYALTVDVRDRLLLVRGAASSDDPGVWWLPGGGLEFGEDPASAVVRELREETGLVGEVDGIVGVFSSVYPTSLERPGDPVHVVGIVFRVLTRPDQLRHEQDGSSDRSAWVAHDDVSGLALSPGARYGAGLAWPDRG